MFINLPIELQHFIYDKLHVNDRKNLNIALVKNKITKSLENDKKLAVINYVFKHKDKYNPTKSDKIINFIKSNIEEPTIKEIIKDNDIILDIPDISKLEIMIKNNDLSEIDKLTDIDLIDLYNKSKIKHSLATYANPNTFNTIINKYVLIDKFFIHDMFFNSLNYKNFELFKYLIQNKDYDDGITYIQLPGICSILAKNLECLEVICENILLPEDTITKITMDAIENMNFKTLEILKKYNLI